MNFKIGNTYRILMGIVPFWSPHSWLQNYRIFIKIRYLMCPKLFLSKIQYSSDFDGNYAILKSSLMASNLCNFIKTDKYNSINSEALRPHIDFNKIFWMGNLRFRWNSKYFWCHQSDRYLSGFDGNYAILKPLLLATKLSQFYQNPITIDHFNGPKTIFIKNSILIGFW